MFSSIKALTRWRISLISAVIFRSGICSSLSVCQSFQPREALFSLLRRLSDCRDDVHDGCRYTVFAISLDLLPACLRAAIHEYLLDNIRRNEANCLLTLAGLPGLHHRPKRLAAAEPLMECVVVRRREIT